MNLPAFRLVGQPFGADATTRRRAAEARLEELHDAMLSLIAALDMLDDDPDLEPSINPGRNPDGSLSCDEREGGDVLDEGEPNDWDENGGDDEPSLGWSYDGQGGVPLGWSCHPIIGAGVDNDD